MKKVLLFVLLFFLFGSIFFASQTSAQTSSIGVNVGDTFVYDFHVAWNPEVAGQLPLGTNYLPWDGAVYTESIAGFDYSQILVNFSVAYRNGTTFYGNVRLELPSGDWIGDHDSVSQYMHAFTSSNRVVGSKIATFAGGFGANETVVIGGRDVNHILFENPSVSFRYLTDEGYYDKQTGVCLSMEFRSYHLNPPKGAYSVRMVLRETSLFVVPLLPSLTSTSTSSPVASQEVTPTSSLEISIAPSPSVPEFQIWASLFLLFVSTLLVCSFARNKITKKRVI
jgi:hypothetical protein